MKTALKITLALAMVIGFASNGISQRKQIQKKQVVVVKHKPVKKVVYTKAPEKITRPALGTIVYQLPKLATPVIIHRSHYVKYNNVLYSQTRINGRKAYKVVRYA